MRLIGASAFTTRYVCCCSRILHNTTQSGCGNTRRATERVPKAPALLPLYVDELAGVAAATGYPRYHVLGDGWGGMLAATAAAAGRLPGAVSLTLLNTPPSYSAWVEDRRQRVRGMCASLHIQTCLAQALQLPGTLGQDLLAADDAAGTLLQRDSAATQAYLSSVVCHRAGSSCLFNSLQDTAVPVVQQLSGGYMFKVRDGQHAETCLENVVYPTVCDALKHLSRLRVSSRTGSCLGAFPCRC